MTEEEIPKELYLPAKLIRKGACGNSFKPDWYCTRNYMHEGPCALWYFGKLWGKENK